MTDYLSPCPNCRYDKNEGGECKKCGRALYTIYTRCSCGFDKNESGLCKKCGEGFIAHNVCNKCGFLWHSLPGPGQGCPNPKGCDSVYWTWKNYKESRPNWCSICRTGFGAV